MTTYIALRPRRNLSPLLTIWTQPRQTAEYVLERSSWLSILVLAALAGLSTMLYLAEKGAALSKVEDLTIVLLIILIGGTVLGMVRVFFGAVIVRWIIDFAGGVGDYRSTCVALAWGTVPEVAALVLQVLLFLMIGPAYLEGADAVQAASAGSILKVSLVMRAVPWLVLWSIVATTNALSQLKQVSSARALFAYCAGTFVAVAVLGVSLLALTEI